MTCTWLCVPDLAARMDHLQDSAPHPLEHVGFSDVRRAFISALTIIPCKMFVPKGMDPYHAKNCTAVDADIEMQRFGLPA